MRKILVALFAPLLLVSGLFAASAASADPPSKDWVCKYVGTPGVDEQLKNGNDGLVWVDTSATQGTYFADAQGRSYVLRADAPHDSAPDGSLCPTSPVDTSPVDTSPVDTSPVATSPVATSPVATSPVATSPVATSPVATPPVATPPVATSPVATPPAATPAAPKPAAPSFTG